MNYDILDNALSTTQLVSNSETITTESRYDANENMTETHSPLAVAGIQPQNKAVISFDERDLLFQITGAPGALEERTVTFNYDKNRNRTEIVDAEDNNGDGQGDITTAIFDGFDRWIGAIDAVGNEINVKRDPASNVVEREYFGPIGGPSRNNNSTVGNVLLAKAAIFYDELSRIFRGDAELFLSNGVTTARSVTLFDNDAIPGDGKVTSFIDYDRDSRTTFITNASPTSALEISRIEYDGFSRSIRALDPENNESLVVYDDNSNPIRVTHIDRSPSGRISQETFTTINVYDSLNRLSRTTDNIGQTRRFFYDSRNLLIRTSDAQGPEIPDPLGLFPGNINADGNTTETIHDGLNRPIVGTRDYGSMVRVAILLTLQIPQTRTARLPRPQTGIRTLVLLLLQTTKVTPPAMNTITSIGLSRQLSRMELPRDKNMIGITTSRNIQTIMELYVLTLSMQLIVWSIRMLLVQ